MDNRHLKTTYDAVDNKVVPTPEWLTKFFDEIEEVCTRFGVSISSESGTSDLQVIPFKQSEMDALRDASLWVQPDIA